VPILAILSTVKSIAEGEPSAKITLRRTGNLADPVQVHLGYSGAALNGTDYTLLPSVIDVPPYEEELELYFEPIVDSENEITESASIKILPNGFYGISYQSEVTIDITDIE